MRFKQSSQRMIDEAAVTQELQSLGVALTTAGDKLRMKDRFQTIERPVAGVQARVEVSGGTKTRSTFTRMAIGTVIAPGVGTVVGAAARKSEDGRSMYLVLTGSDWIKSFKVDPKHEDAARDFSDRV